MSRCNFDGWSDVIGEVPRYRVCYFVSFQHFHAPNVTVGAGFKRLVEEIWR